MAPWVLFAFVLMLIPTIKKNKKLSLTSSEKFSCYWYLVNGSIIHIIMDGLVGVFHAYDPLDLLYKQMDTRFETHDHIPITIGLIEIVFMGPCCLYLSYLYVNQRSIEREVLSIVVSTV